MVVFEDALAYVQVAEGWRLIDKVDIDEDDRKRKDDGKIHENKIRHCEILLLAKKITHSATSPTMMCPKRFNDFISCTIPIFWEDNRRRWWDARFRAESGKVRAVASFVFPFVGLTSTRECIVLLLLCLLSFGIGICIFP
jgi:hypothetical protein